MENKKNLACKKCGSKNIILCESQTGTQSYKIDNETGAIEPTDFVIHDSSMEFVLCLDCHTQDTNFEVEEDIVNYGGGIIMSHYAVAVICKNVKQVDKMLEPFDESLEVAPYINFTKAQILAEYEERLEVIRTGVSERYNVEHLREHEHDYYANIEAYTEAYYGDSEFDADGNVLVTYNPKSQWDWYSIGGRWSNFLTKKDGSKCDYAKIKDINFEADANDEEAKEKLRKNWDEVLAGKGYFKPEYLLNKHKTVENYIKDTLTFSTYAILDKAGVWHEPGKMGWFGCSSATPESEVKFNNEYAGVIASADQNDYLVIVDCHI